MRRVADRPAARMPAVRILARGLIAPLVAGALCVFAFAPFYVWPVPIVAFALLFFLWAHSASPLQAALSGFAFGLGYFLAGVWWIFVSLHYFGAMPTVLAAIATFLLCCYLALFPAAAGWIAVRFSGGSPGRSLILATAAFVLLEWVRGWLFTGFPWLTAGTSQAPESPLAGFAPYVGVYGVSLALLGAAGLLVALLSRGSEGRRRIVLLVAFAAVFILGVLGGLIPWTEPAGAPLTVALLQGNVPQQLKWREDVRAKTLLDYRRMIFEARARVVVLPETALPAFLDQIPPDYLDSLREHARKEGKEILLGSVERQFRGQDFDYYNSVVRITGTPIQTYRKRHLVPFGEFIPVGFKWVLAILKIPLSDFARGDSRQAPLEAAGVQFGVAICYEDMFGEEVIETLPEAQVLLNVSNDAWFGDSVAADQHLQGSQMRALETGRWMVRATNTGVTAAIDERGRIVSRLPEFVAGTLIASVVPRRGLTPYARWGNVPALLVLLALVAVGVRKRSRG